MSVVCQERSKHVAETKAREASQEQAAKREKVTLMSAAASAIRMKLEMMVRACLFVDQK